MDKAEETEQNRKLDTSGNFSVEGETFELHKNEKLYSHGWRSFNTSLKTLIAQKYRQEFYAVHCLMTKIDSPELLVWNYIPLKV